MSLPVASGLGHLTNPTPTFCNLTQPNSTSTLVYLPWQVSHGVTVVAQTEHHHRGKHFSPSADQVICQLRIKAKTNEKRSDKQNTVRERYEYGQWHGDQEGGKHFLLPGCCPSLRLLPTTKPRGTREQLLAPIIITTRLSVHVLHKNRQVQISQKPRVVS